MGASIVEVIHPIELAFEPLGTTFQEEVDLIPCDPIYSYIFRTARASITPSPWRERRR